MKFFNHSVEKMDTIQETKLVYEEVKDIQKALSGITFPQALQILQIVELRRINIEIDFMQLGKDISSIQDDVADLNRYFGGRHDY